jgi:hypothetical protein
MYMAPEVFKELPYSEKVGHGTSVMFVTVALTARQPRSAQQIGTMSPLQSSRQDLL